MNALSRLSLFVLILSGMAGQAPGNEFEDPLRVLAESELHAIIADPALIEAIRGQNETTSGFSAEQIRRLDQRWRDEVGATDRPLIDSVLDHTASTILRRHRDRSGGLYTEIFVMDAIGLNVASSDTTSDYWQGDEVKWIETYSAGPGAMHIGGIEFDESTQSYQSQVSLTVVDPETGRAIGAATFGVNVEWLN